MTELQAANRELVRANDELARAGQLKTAFIEVASHEFNTPITLVLGLTELLRLCKPITHPTRNNEILRQITASGKQLARLVTNMLTLLRAEDFRKTLERRPGRSGRSDRSGSSTRSGCSPTCDGIELQTSWRMTWARSRSTPTRSARS